MLINNMVPTYTFFFTLCRVKEDKPWGLILKICPPQENMEGKKYEKNVTL